jgi:Domain of unknown function (DUF4129)
MWRLTRRTRAGAATLGLIAAVVVVAIAAGQPLSYPTAVNARSAQTPTTAVFMLLAGTGVVMLGTLIVMAWPGRRRTDDPPEHEPTHVEVPLFWKVVATALPLALGGALIAAAMTGTRSRRTGPGFGSALFGAGAGPGARSTGAGEGFAVPGWLPWTLLAIVAVAVAAAVLASRLARRRQATEPAESDDTAGARAAVDAAIGALDDEADPRRAVIAAYGAMQRAFGERGVVRLPAEAPREYLERALVAGRTTEPDARTLTGLFEEARYSTHAVPERLRVAALTALRSLQQRLQAEGVR